MKKRLIISSVISIFLVSVLLLGSTYSIFTSQEIDATANVYKTGNLNVTYSIKNVDNTNSVKLTDPTPMTIEEADAVIPYRVTVTNSGNVPYEFDVILLDTTSSTDNTIDYQYIMTKVGYLDPIALNNCTNNIIKENVIVPAGEKVDIDVRIWLDSMLPNTQIGKSFYAKLKIDGLAVYNDDENIDNSKLSLRYMKTSSTNDFKNDAYRTYITTASFVDYIDTTNASINTETNEKIMWDLSTNQDNRIIAWLEENDTTDDAGNKYYDLYIGSTEKIYAKSLDEFFRGMSILKNTVFDNLDTSLTTNMRSMFCACSGLINLDLSSFDTGNVVVMNVPSHYASGGMFDGCTSLMYLDISSFDTSNIKLFGNMFRNCSNLIELDLSNFDTSCATDIGQMFIICKNLVRINLKSFDTSSVVNMEKMFYGCSKLIELDLSSFDTSNITNMAYMFYGCEKLSNLNLSSFDTSNITNMAHMFARCGTLQNLNIDNFDTSNVTDMSFMFSGCVSLTRLDLSNFDTSNVTLMSFMFQGCSSLQNLNIDNFDTSNVINISYMLQKCPKLKTRVTIRSENITSINFLNMLAYSANTEGASIVFYYVGDNPNTLEVNESTYDLVEAMIGTGTGNVINGGCVGNYCSI